MNIKLIACCIVVCVAMVCATVVVSLHMLIKSNQEEQQQFMVHAPAK